MNQAISIWMKFWIEKFEFHVLWTWLTESVAQIRKYGILY